jgi:hypothetical protein
MKISVTHMRQAMRPHTRPCTQATQMKVISCGKGEVVALLFTGLERKAGFVKQAGQYACAAEGKGDSKENVEYL